MLNIVPFIKSPHPAFGVRRLTLPFFEREKALNDYRLLPCLLAWEKVPNGRMRALDEGGDIRHFITPPRAF